MIADLIKCEILIVSQTSEAEISNLIKREEIASLANIRLANEAISFQDYLDCLEIAGVNIDEYLQISDDNCREAGY